MANDVAYQPIRALSDTIGLHKTLAKLLVPRAGRDSIVKLFKYLANPGELALRRKLHRATIASGTLTAASVHLRDEGYHVFAPGELQGSELAVKASQEAFADYERRGGTARKSDHFKADFLVSILKAGESLQYPDILRFVLSPQVIELASRYFGEVPVLGGVSLNWSPKNETLKESQLFHRDGEDRLQLKFLLNISEVRSDSGPLNLVPAPQSEKVMRELGYNTGRIQDEDVVRIAGADKIVSCAGPTGQIAVVDTSRCLHYGSRGNKNDRLVLFVQFVRFLAPKQNYVKWPSTISEVLPQLDEVQRRVLNFT